MRKLNEKQLLSLLQIVTEWFLCDSHAFIHTTESVDGLKWIALSMCFALHAAFRCFVQGAQRFVFVGIHHRNVAWHSAKPWNVTRLFSLIEIQSIDQIAVKSVFESEKKHRLCSFVMVENTDDWYNDLIKDYF